MGDALLTYLDAMGRFAALADLVHSEAEAFVDWEAVGHFASSVEPYLREVCQEARRLVVNHEARLGLGAGSEPFRVDYGMHRWLKNECEPAYSDWLQWLVEAIERRDWIFTLLGIPADSHIISAATPKVSAVGREVPVRQQDDCALVGFLDLDIWFGKHARIVVELKTFDQSFEKQLRYKEALDVGQVETEFVLLTKDHPDKETVFGFRTKNWEYFCLEARRLVSAVAQARGVVVASLMLAFIGAVEQNVLELNGEGVRKLFRAERDDAIGTVDSRTFRYLQKLSSGG